MEISVTQVSKGCIQSVISVSIGYKPEQ